MSEDIYILCIHCFFVLSNLGIDCRLNVELWMTEFIALMKIFRYVKGYCIGV